MPFLVEYKCLYFQEDIDDYIKGDKLAVVEYYAIWCGPFKIISQQIDVSTNCTGNNLHP